LGAIAFEGGSAYESGRASGSGFSQGKQSGRNKKQDWRYSHREEKKNIAPVLTDVAVTGNCAKAKERSCANNSKGRVAVFRCLYLLMSRRFQLGYSIVALE
jgi:hypothetical protein